MDTISFVAVEHDRVADYMALGKASYAAHYLHLWEGKDPSSFFKTYLSEKVVRALVDQPSAFPHIILFENRPAGILNVSLQDDCSESHQDRKTLLLDKMYILKEFTGQHLGSTALMFIERLAIKHKASAIVLYAMKKGKPFLFYKKNGYQVVGETEITLPHVLPNEKGMYIMEKTIPLTARAKP